MRTTEAILHVDATPDADYPLRILRAYRHNCVLRWSSKTLGYPDSEENNPIIIALNEMQDKRLDLLDKAIATLEASHPAQDDHINSAVKHICDVDDMPPLVDFLLNPEDQ